MKAQLRQFLPITTLLIAAVAGAQSAPPSRAERDAQLINDKLCRAREARARGPCNPPVEPAADAPRIVRLHDQSTNWKIVCMCTYSTDHTRATCERCTAEPDQPPQVLARPTTKIPLTVRLEPPESDREMERAGVSMEFRFHALEPWNAILKDLRASATIGQLAWMITVRPQRIETASDGADWFHAAVSYWCRSMPDRQPAAATPALSLPRTAFTRRIEAAVLRDCRD